MPLTQWLINPINPTSYHLISYSSAVPLLHVSFQSHICLILGLIITFKKLIFDCGNIKKYVSVHVLVMFLYLLYNVFIFKLLSLSSNL